MPNYIFQGNSNIWYSATLGDQEAPSVAEIGAATELTNDVGEVNGFGETSNYVDVPVAGRRRVARIPGTIHSEDSDLLIWCKTEGDTLRATLKPDVTGFIIIRQGIVSTEPIGEGDVVHVYPIVVSNTPFQRPLGDTAASWRVQVAISGAISVDVEVVDES